jgi:hypothetical protein
LQDKVAAKAAKTPAFGLAMAPKKLRAPNCHQIDGMSQKPLITYV